MLRMLTACFGAALGAQDPGQPEQPILTTFAWPAKASATVTESVTIGRRTTTMRYRLVTTPREAGGFTVRREGVELLRLQGQRPTRRQQADAVTANALPEISIATDGRFERVGALAPLIDRLVAVHREAGHDEEQLKLLRERLEHPQSKVRMAAELERVWNAWAGAWIDWSLPSGTSDDRPLDGEPAPPADPDALQVGTPPSNRNFARHHGAAKDHPGCIRLSGGTQRLGVAAAGPAAAQVFALAQKYEIAPEDLDEALHCTTTERYEVVTDPKTLLPREAVWTRRIWVVHEASNEARKRTQKHRYVFAWHREGKQPAKTGKASKADKTGK